MEYMKDRSFRDYEDQYSKGRNEKYGECQTCNKYNTYWTWYQSCNPKLLTEGWTTGNEILDELIKGTQLKATEYKNMDYNNYYLQWIPYNDLTNIERLVKVGLQLYPKLLG